MRVCRAGPWWHFCSPDRAPSTRVWEAVCGRPIPDFRETIKECDAILGPLLGRSIEEILYPAPDDPEALIHQTQFTQPAMFVLAYALSGLWSSWGIRPDFVLGHSLGEYVAACVAGIVSLEDALNMVVQRARLMQSVSSRGAMAAVMAPEEQVARRLSSYADTVSISAVNGPANVVISGAAEDIEHISESFQQDGVSVVPLKVSHAFHSPLMEPVLASFEKSISGIRFNSPRLRFVSNVSGTVAAGEEVANPGYWRRHARNPVRFMDGMKTLVDQGCRLFIEIGPKPVLLNMGRRCTAGEGLRWLPSLDGKTDDWKCILDSLAEVYLAGAEVDWKGFDAPFHRRRISLPTYRFQGRRFWFTDDGATTVRWEPQLGPTDMPGIASAFGNADGYGQRPNPFQIRHRSSSNRFFYGTPGLRHLVAPHGRRAGGGVGGGRAVVAAGRLRAVGAGQHGPGHHPAGGWWRRAGMDAGPLRRGIHVQALQSTGDVIRGGGLAGACHPAPSNPSMLKTRAGRMGIPRRPWKHCDSDVQKRADADLFYDNFTRIGLDFGPAFRTLETVWSGRGEAFGRLCHRPDAPDANAGFVLSPLALDGALQVVAAALMEGDFDNDGAVGLHLPVGVDHARLSQVADGPFWAHAVIREKETSTSRTVLCDVRLLDDRSQEIALLSGCRLLPVDAGALAAISESSLTKLLYQPSWQQLIEPEQPASDTAVSLRAVEERMKKALPELARAQRFEEYERACDDMDRLVSLYITRAMTRLGWHPEPGQWISRDTLAETLQVAERHRQLFKRFLDILTEDGFLEPASDDGWHVVRVFPREDFESDVETLTPGSETGEPEFDLIVRCGEQAS